MVRPWLLLIVEDIGVVNDGLGYAVGCSSGMLHVDDGLLISWYLERLQGALNFLIGMLLRTGLAANVAKSKTMN